MGCLYSAHVGMIRIPAVRQKGETDTIRTQLLYTIALVSEMACPLSMTLLPPFVNQRLQLQLADNSPEHTVLHSLDPHTDPP